MKYLSAYVEPSLELLGRGDKIGVNALRIAFAIIFLWIGALKFVPYEADSITPFVANSPVLEFFYKHPDQYKAHLTHEGQLVPEQRAWQRDNNTYAFSIGLGIVEITIGTLVLLNPISALVGLIGGFLAFATPIVTLSFLVTTPEAWVQPLGDAEFGFPFLSGAGRLVLKDTAILAGGILVMADSARTLLAQIRQRRESAKLAKGGNKLRVAQGLPE
ncbi:MAG TPA: reactive chlorine resistance membrane protein RclC [Dongiaceae bacterium]|nr:reactive chlorine resistance membrane protein RclC [Dongiaceae bacterium]